MKKVLIQFNFPGMTAKTYDNVWSDLRASGNSNPKGLIHHFGAPVGNDFTVTDVWESEEAFNKFGETLLPILQKHNVPAVKPTVAPVHYEYKGQVSQTV